jgi:CelD/BcsL family acetyltransferase involved in cellulose biosynthesis
MKIELIRTTEGFASLRDRWIELCGERADLSIFQSWEWQYLWWTHYGREGDLYLLEASEGSRLVGVLPLYLARAPLLAGLYVRLLRPVGTGGDTSPDYLGPIAIAGREREFASACLAWLREHEDWDSLLLCDLMPQAPILEEMVFGSAMHPWTVDTGISARISHTRLPQSWEDYLASLGRDRRYTLRNTRRKFLALEGARFFLWEDGGRLDEAITRLIELHHLRWTAKGGSHSFSSERYTRFHRGIMRKCLELNRLRLYCMELAGEIIAMCYCYAWADTVFYFQSGFDPRHEKLRPGLCLMGYAFEHAIGEGRRCFDMLRGEYEYKTQWAKDVRTTHYAHCHRPGLRTLFYRAHRGGLPQLKGAVKAILALAGLS